MSSSPQQWAEQFDLMNKLKKLLKENTEIFHKFHIKGLLFQILKWADSLRSALSKSALSVISELCTHLSDLVDPELEQVLHILLRKSTDTNVFIAEEGQRALLNACLYCCDRRVTSILLQQSRATRSGPVKAKIALCLNELFSHKDPKRLKDLDQLIQLLAVYLREASPEVRKNAKEAFKSLANAL